LWNGWEASKKSTPVARLIRGLSAIRSSQAVYPSVGRPSQVSLKYRLS
jgi:hypothetical protein